MHLCIFPGAVYCDLSLRTKGFTGEGVQGSSTLVVKTHESTPKFPGRRLRTDLRFFRAGILLLRNPKDSLVADWNRRRSKTQNKSTISNHYLYVGEEYFGKGRVLCDNSLFSQGQDQEDGDFWRLNSFHKLFQRDVDKDPGRSACPSLCSKH